jgi:Cytochrome P450
MEKKMAEGTQRDCFAVQYIKIAETQQFDENQKYFTGNPISCLRLIVAGTLLEAGSDTTRVSLGQMIAGAATYPEWVATARKELDAVCGANAERLPEWSDHEKLPYITAAVKESFRFDISSLGH